MKLRELTEPFEAVLITWFDAASYEDGWYGSQDELPDKPLIVETLGWLVKKNDDVVIISRTVSKFKLESILVIPSSLIISIAGLPNDDD